MATKGNTTSAIAKVEGPLSLSVMDKYGPLVDPEMMRDVTANLMDNLAGEKLRTRDLTQIRVPSGEMTQWKIPSVDGDAEYVKEVTGIIIHMTMPRAFWAEAYGTSDNAPPSCFSFDSKVGHGDPGGDCESCPFSDFGSGANGSQGCKQRRMFYLLVEGEFLPIAVNCPPGSLAKAKDYLLGLGKKGLRFDTVMTTFTLTTEKNKANIKFPQVSFKMAAQLDPEVIERVRAYSAALKPILNEIAPDRQSMRDE
jgi:hypothetical protein